MHSFDPTAFFSIYQYKISCEEIWNGVQSVGFYCMKKKRTNASFPSPENYSIPPERYITIFDRSPISTQIFAPNGLTISVNKAWEKLWGIPAEKIIGKYNILNDKQLIEKGAMRSIKKAFAGTPAAIPTIRYEPEQSVGNIATVPYKILKASAYPVKDTRGILQEVVLMHEDITDQILYEENLKASEERYKTFIRNSSEGIWRFELDTSIATSLSVTRQIQLIYKYAYLAECNDSLAKMYGYKKAQDLIGRRIGEFLIESDEQNTAYLQAFIQSGYRLSGVESHEKDNKGNEKYFRNSLVGTISNGYVIRAWGTQQDITNEKIATRELMQSKDKLSIVLNGVADGISMQDKDGKLVYINDAGAKISGFKNASDMLAIRKPTYIQLFAIVDEKGNPLSIAKLPGRRALSGEKFPEAIIGYKDQKTHETRWSLVKARPIFDEKGVVQFAINIFHDITDIRNSEQQMKMQSQVLESMAEGVSLSDDRGFIVYTNSTEDLLFGYPRGELVGKHVSVQNAYSPEENKRIVRSIITQLKKKGTWEGELQNITKAGIPFTTYARITAIQIAGKKYFVCVQQDITSWKKAQEELLQSEEKFRLLVETTNIIPWESDISTGNFTYVGPQAEKLVGYKTDEWYKDHFWDNHIHPEDKAWVIDYCMTTSKKLSQYEFEYRMLRKDGSMIWFRDIVTVIKKNKKPILLRGFMVDITERKLLEKQKDEFIGIASHELKTPVTSLKAYAQVIRRRFERIGDESSAQQLAKMDAQLDKLTNLISDLLDVTKLETNKLFFENEEYSLQELAEEIIEELQRTTDSHTIIFKGNITKALYGDKERTGQVLINLITNALKYSPRAEKIIVKLTEGKDGVTCCVEDFGVGIAEKHKDKIFERFYRISGPKQDTYPGLGLGLYISSEIIKRQKGKIWIENKKTHGAMFCFYLPFSPKVSKKAM